MSNQSIIEHKANMHYVEFREDYLMICLACTYKKPVKGKEKSKASPYCKALILAISESWTNDKRGKGTDLSFYMTYPQWCESMYGMFGRNVVIDSVDELIGEGLLKREPIKYKGKDTFRYALDHAEINRRMKELPERTPYNTRPQVNGLISKRDEKSTRLLVNGMAFTNQPDTRLLVNDDPFTKGRNIESTYHQDIDSAQNTDDTYAPASPTDVSASALASATHTPSHSQDDDVLAGTAQGELNGHTHQHHRHPASQWDTLHDPGQRPQPPAETSQPDTETARLLAEAPGHAHGVDRGDQSAQSTTGRIAHAPQAANPPVEPAPSTLQGNSPRVTTRDENNNHSQFSTGGVDKSAAGSAKGTSAQPQQATLLVVPAQPSARLEKPAMPPDSVRWCPETMVQITEAKLGKRYREATREKQVNAARRILREDPLLTREQYVLAYDERDDDWWHEHKGPLHVNHMAEKDRVHAMLERIEVNKARKPNAKPATPEQSTEMDVDKLVTWTRYTHSGRAIDHWYLYEVMPVSEALRYGWEQDAIVPNDKRNIRTRLKALKDGHTTLTPEQQAEVDSCRVVA